MIGCPAKCCRMQKTRACCAHTCYSLPWPEAINLKDPPMQPPPMTKQQIFDTVAKHLLQQNRTSISTTTSSCAYFGEDNTRCAIGALMLVHPGAYNTNWGVSEILKKCPNLLPPISDLSRRSWPAFFVDLQHIHDSVPSHQWRDNLRIFAKNRHLSARILSAP